jgi:miniconductance mechanosensitive channel
MNVIIDILVSMGVPQFIVSYLAIAQGLLVYFLIVWLGLYIWLKKLPKKLIPYFHKHSFSKQLWRVFILSYLTYYTHVIKDIHPEYTTIIAHIWTILASATIISSSALLIARVGMAVDIYETYAISKRFPIRPYTQVLRMLLVFAAGIIIISIFLNKSPLAFFTGLGATLALVTVLFKDTIAGFMASVQVSSFDIARIGDWITIPKYAVDGNVLEISLTTVKVQNFDKTIVMIPTSALLTDGVKNWRGMFDSGGRRIKKSIPIDMNSIRFYSETELHELSTKYDHLNIDFSKNLNNMTLFRAYIEHFISLNENIHQEGFLFLIRELDPSERGLPLEFYVFTKQTRWADHEKVQAEILDYALASLRQFDLRALQLAV